MISWHEASKKTNRWYIMCSKYDYTVSFSLCVCVSRETTTTTNPNMKRNVAHSLSHQLNTRSKEQKIQTHASLPLTWSIRSLFFSSCLSVQARYYLRELWTHLSFSFTWWRKRRERVKKTSLTLKTTSSHTLSHRFTLFLRETQTKPLCTYVRVKLEWKL